MRYKFITHISVRCEFGEGRGLVYLAHNSFKEPHPAVLWPQSPLVPWSPIYWREEEEDEESAWVVFMGQASEWHTSVPVTFSLGELYLSDTHSARDTGKCSLAVSP